MELTCVVCPRSCHILITWSLADGRLLDMEGFRCPLGRDWAEQEFLAPMRTLCTSVGVIGGSAPLVSVKTAGAIPLASYGRIMEQIRQIWVDAPIRAGTIVGSVLYSDDPSDIVELIATATVAAS